MLILCYSFLKGRNGSIRSLLLSDLKNPQLINGNRKKKWKPRQTQTKIKKYRNQDIRGFSSVQIRLSLLQPLCLYVSLSLCVGGGCAEATQIEKMLLLYFPVGKFKFIKGFSWSLIYVRVQCHSWASGSGEYKKHS